MSTPVVTAPTTMDTMLDGVRRLNATLGSGASRRGRTARSVIVGLLYILFMTQGIGLSASNVINGIALGSLYGIIGVALVLVYRTSRIINFAAAALGAVPAIFGLLLTTEYGLPYPISLVIAAAGGLGVGSLTERLVLRKFSSSPRLIVTVVSIGLAQTFGVLGFFVPVWLGQKAGQSPAVKTPWGGLAIHNHRGEPIISGNQVFALLLVIVLTVGLSLFFSRTRLGIAVRASSENAERAALLGVPVHRVTNVAWALAGLLATLAIFAQAPLLGVPGDATLGFGTLLYGLAAAVVAGLERFGTALVAGAAIGLVIFASVARTGTNDVASAVMLVVILIALLAQRGTLSRARDAGAATWQTVRSYRPIPAELRDLPEVRVARYAGLGAFALLALFAPSIVGGPRLVQLQLLPIYGIVAVSLVVLTGWAGQISLGQFGLVGIGAIVSGGIVANHNIDFFAALAIGVGAGALAAVLIGLPAIRIQGLYLAVTTLAFGFAMKNYVLNPSFAVGKFLLPHGYSTIHRPRLYSHWDLENDSTYYYVCLVALVAVIAAALSFRAHRSGRVLIAMRDNQRAAASYTLNPVKTRLAAFAVSGGMAGLAGTLLAYSEHNIFPNSYDVTSSIFVFLAASVAGMTSVLVAVYAVVLLEAAVIFGPSLYGSSSHQTLTSAIPLILTGPLLVLTLYRSPGGIAGDLFEARDKLLRRVAMRRNLAVPSLIEDRRIDAPAGELDLVAAAQHEHQAAERSLYVPGPRLACPVCHEPLSLDNVGTHEHLIVSDGADLVGVNL